MKRVLISLTIIAAILYWVVQGSTAFFSDTETSNDNVFTAGAIDLQIGNTSYYNGAVSSNTSWSIKSLTGELFFNFLDLKPGDLGEDTIAIRVQDNDAWACANITITENDDVSSTEPELGDGDSPNNIPDLFDGELAEHLNFLFWHDDGDNVLEDDEDILTLGPASQVLAGVTWPIADSTINTVGGNPGEPLSGGQTYYIGKAWCFGTLTPSALPQDGSGTSRTPIDSNGPGVLCDGSLLNNLTQTDKLKGDIHFYAVQARNNPEFVCEPSIFATPTPSIPPTGTITPTPTPLACAPVYGNSVASSAQGTLNNGNPITDPTRTNPGNALGVANGQFFSIGKTGTVTLAFASPISNLLGYDMTISTHEITNGRDSYPEERAKVEVSQDGVTFAPLFGFATSEPGGGGDGITNIDFAGSGLPAIQYVRLTDATNWAIHDTFADGYDLDAIRGNCQVQQ